MMNIPFSAAAMPPVRPVAKPVHFQGASNPDKAELSRRELLGAIEGCMRPELAEYQKKLADYQSLPRWKQWLVPGPSRPDVSVDMIRGYLRCQDPERAISQKALSNDLFDKLYLKSLIQAPTSSYSYRPPVYSHVTLTPAGQHAAEALKSGGS